MGEIIDITGEVFNGLVVTGFSHKKGKKNYWKVTCSCGKERSPLRADSLKKHSGLCTCPLEVGEVYGKLSFVEKTRTVGRRSYANVKCSCGKVYETRIDTFKSNISGCGSCPNIYTTGEGKAYIDVSTKLHPNKITTILEHRLEETLKYKWYYIEGEGGIGYIQASDKKDRLLLHRVITDCPEDLVVDHISGNTLDNTDANLRVGDRVMNAKNTKIPKTNTSGVMGVSLKHKGGGWRAYITVNNRQVHIGHYEHFEDAVAARKEAEVEYGFHPNHGRK